MAEADESAAAAEPEAPKAGAGARGLDDEEDTEVGDVEVGDDQTILECLLDKVNIIKWLLDLNSDSDGKATFFQVRPQLQ